MVKMESPFGYFHLWFGVTKFERVQDYRRHVKDEHPEKIKHFRLCNDYQLTDKIVREEKAKKMK
jgi:hypothetical protein